MIICFDLETTGLDKRNDKIIEISMIKFDEKNYQIIDSFNSLVDPEIWIPEVISNITNIFDADVKWAPKIEELVKEIEEFIWDTPLLGHNVFFDIEFFLNNNIDIKDNIAIDTFFLANFLSYTSSSLNLEVLCKFYGVSFSGAHRAENDVKATIALFKELMKEFSKLNDLKKELLYFIFSHSEDKNIMFLLDLLYSKSIKEINFDTFEKKILTKIWKYENLAHAQKKSAQESHIWSNFDVIYKDLWTVETRENQIKMTKEVYSAFQTSRHCVMEAPTGLWKSFAYLIPAIIHSIQTGEKVFISTKTKNLQDQLFEKDLKFLSENIHFSFSYAKLKWKKNYLSLHSFFDDILLWEFTYTKVGFIAKITLWLLETTHGELDELNYFWQEFSFLKNMNSDNFVLLWDKNPYWEYEFLLKARSQVESSDIVIINHSLLFSDMNSDNSILWEIQNLVVDEAHNIEDSITDSLKERYNLKTFSEQLDIIESILTKKKLSKIHFLQYKEAIFSKLDLLDDYAMSYINTHASSNYNYVNLLLKQDFFQEIDFSELLKKIELDILDMIDNLGTFWEYNFTKESSFLQANLVLIKNILDKNSDNTYIKLLNYNEKSGVSFEQTLLNPWTFLLQNLWKNTKSIVLTSATLQIWDTFDYIKNILQLQDFDFLSFKSDFDYKTQSTLFIPTDLWDIKNNSTQVISFLWSFYSVVRWKTLTLLTSFSMIKNIYTGLNIVLKKKWISLYAQSLAWSKSKLMNFYLDDSENAILLGTDSFWEWVDIPGDDLKYLVIHKFPFSVPTDPIFQARSVFFKDPFSEYSVPKAIIKLKQWFWRLIRSKNDTGIVILLDSRIHNMTWWKEFLKAFPSDINIKKWSWEKFINLLKSRNLY